MATLCDRGGRVSLPPPAARGRTCRPHAVLPQVASAAAWKWKVPGSSSHHARSMKNERRRTTCADGMKILYFSHVLRHADGAASPLGFMNLL